MIHLRGRVGRRHFQATPPDDLVVVVSDELGQHASGNVSGEASNDPVQNSTPRWKVVYCGTSRRTFRVTHASTCASFINTSRSLRGPDSFANSRPPRSLCGGIITPTGPRGRPAPTVRVLHQLLQLSGRDHVQRRPGVIQDRVPPGVLVPLPIGLAQKLVERKRIDQRHRDEAATIVSLILNRHAISSS